MSLIVTALFLITGLLNTVPAIGVTSANHLQGIYGVELSDHDLIVLLRHRAVLFGIVGAILLAAAFLPWLRYTAGAAGLVSMLSFVALAPPGSQTSRQLQKVSQADIVGSVLLAVALLLNAVG